MKKQFRNCNVEVVATDLQALLFWAGVGVIRSKGGTYERDIEHILDSYNAYLGIKPYPLPRFMQKKPRFIRKKI